MNEILKKRIKEACREHYEFRRTHPHDDVKNFAFVEGAAFALSHQWINVEEALPEDDETALFIDKNGSMQLLTMNDIRKQHKIWDAMFMGVSRDLLEERICYMDEIIAWMPIPKFETKDKEDKR